MKKYLLMVCLLVLMSCLSAVKNHSFVKNMGFSTVDSLRLNILNGTALAVRQDELIADYKANKEVSKETIDSLRGNAWVIAAETLCPSNLVIRQWCLVDLFTRTPDTTRLISMLKLLSYDGKYKGKIWAEGYSYWCYTKKMLNEWDEAFANATVRQLIEEIDIGFIKTSYLRGDQWYPATFGDVRDIPLEGKLQNTIKRLDMKSKLQQSWKIAIVEKIVIDSLKIQYRISGQAIGLNTHIDVDSFTVSVTNGKPENFHFYEGYDKKYKNQYEEWQGILNEKRIKSLETLK